MSNLWAIPGSLKVYGYFYLMIDEVCKNVKDLLKTRAKAIKKG
jgi:hypothetical protein